MADRFEKLPKWAQDEIKRLVRDLNDANDKIEQMGSGNSRITWGSLFEKNGIPENATVNFSLDNDIVNVRIDKRENVLVISTSRTLTVLPRAANSIWLKSIEQ